MIKRKQLFKKNTPKNNDDFRTIIANYTDEQLKNVLKQRTHYAAEAARFAIDEAISRGLIHSEQDLLAEEYRVAELDVSLFPKIGDENTKAKIRRSIARSMVICAVIPVVYALVQLNSGRVTEGSLVLLGSILWGVCSSQLIRLYQQRLVYILLALAVVAEGYIFTKLILSANVVFMDFFIPAVLFVMVVYGLVFLLKLHTPKIP